MNHAHANPAGGDHDHHVRPMCDEWEATQSMLELFANPAGCEPLLSYAEQQQRDLTLVDAFARYLIAADGSMSDESTAWKSFESVLADGAAKGLWVYTTSDSQPLWGAAGAPEGTCRCATEPAYGRAIVSEQLLLMCYDLGCARMKPEYANAGQSLNETSGTELLQVPPCPILSRISTGNPPQLFNAFGEPLHVGEELSVLRRR